ncbi:HEAT repeat domain-containing protein [bacterium]|nr:HEAT repeat domain-containing protein [bacterium]
MAGWLIALSVLIAPPGNTAGRSFSADKAHKKLIERLSRPPVEQVESSPVSASDVPTRDLTDDQLLEQLNESTWVLRSASSDPPLAYRPPWHHPAVTEMVARIEGNPNDKIKLEKVLAERLRRGGPVGRFHSALVLAETGSTRGIEELNRHLLDEDSPLPSRSQAACALARFGKMLDPVGFEKLLTPWLADGDLSRRVLAEKDEPLIAALAHALFAAREADPSYDPSQDQTALLLARAPSPVLRRVVAMGHAGRPWTEISSLLEQLLRDSDPAVRRSALAALLAHPTPAGREVVLRLTRDGDIAVSVTAIRGLNAYPDNQTLTRLAELAESASPLVREAVMASAGQLGQEGIVLRGAGDSQASVRVAAARSLAGMKTPSSLAALSRLLDDDRASVVQSAVLESLEQVPPRDSVPLFFHAMESSSARTRTAAAEGLARVTVNVPFRDQYAEQSFDHWRQTLASFRPTDPPESRGPQVLAMKEAWTSLIPKRSLGTVGGAGPNVARVDDLALQKVCAQLARGPLSADRIAPLSSVPLTNIEQALLSADLLPSREFIRKILEPRDSAYGMMVDLDQASPSVVTTLVVQFDRRPMTNMQAVMVAMAARPEGGRDLWIRLVPLAMKSLAVSTEPIAKVAIDRLTRLGLTHADEMVREMTCQQIEAYPLVATPDGLASVMTDPSERVRRAAIRAAGATADQGTKPSLREAMKSSSVAIQLEAAAQLLAQGDKEGFETLRRLVASPDDEVRRRVVEELTKNPRVDREGTLQLLTQLLSDAKLEIRQRALVGLEEVVGPLEGDPDRGIGRPRVFTEEQVSRWKRTMASYFSPADSDEKLRRMELIRKTQESLQVLPVAN